MILLELFTSFFKIGAVSFGGGYAMIPLIASEIISHGWMENNDFIQILAIAEMTPGPIAVNSATFVGYKTTGVFGSAFATFGVALPSLLIILLVSQFFFKYNNHPLTKLVFYGIRPVIAGLIISAVIFIGKTTLITVEGDWNINTLWITGIMLILAFKTKIHPILLIVISGILGYSTLLI